MFGIFRRLRELERSNSILDDSIKYLSDELSEYRYKEYNPARFSRGDVLSTGWTVSKVRFTSNKLGFNNDVLVFDWEYECFNCETKEITTLKQSLLHESVHKV